MDVQVF